MKTWEKWSLIVLASGILVFSYLWTEGFGIKPRYSYGDTISETLNFWYARGISDKSFKKEIMSENLDNNRILMVYETKDSKYGVSILKKKWNNKWVEVGGTGVIPINQPSSTGDDIELCWSNCNEYGVALGHVYNNKIKYIKQNGVDAKIFNISSNKRAYYVVNKGNFDRSDLKFITNTKGYDSNYRVIYSYH